MKKLFTLLMVAMMFAFSACNSCNKVEKEQTVEDILTADYDYMVENYDTTFVWYETQIVLNNYLDEEACDGSYESIMDVFQVITRIDSTSFEPLVVKMIHVGDSLQIETVKDFWVEDMSMNDEQINVTYAEAFKLMNEANYPKPHSKNCVLRKEVGPKVANAQYIFGNIKSQIYVDATTGAVSDESPSFNTEVKEYIEEVFEEVVE